MPPNTKKFPDASIQLTEESLALGTLSGAATPLVPYTPFCFATADPLIHAHSPFLYSHKSFRSASVPCASNPLPPNIQKFPDESFQLTGEMRAPGIFAIAGAPRVP